MERKKNSQTFVINFLDKYGSSWPGLPGNLSFGITATWTSPTNNHVRFAYVLFQIPFIFEFCKVRNVLSDENICSTKFF